MVVMPGIENLMPYELSGGMRKAVALARALAMNPDIVLYDEPNVGLDPITSGAITDLIIKTQNEFGVTSVVASHDIPLIERVSTRVALLYEGKIVEEGTTEEMDASDNPIVRQFMSGSVEGPIVSS